jgi:multidrug efflux pump subunit AcrA (membrane-fusion protein)
MKNKILKILERPWIVIPATLLFALIVGFIVYKTIGVPPKNDIVANPNSDISVPNTSSETFQNGQAIDLSFPKGGRINQVLVKVGDMVKKGQTLAALDSSDALGALNIAKANYDKTLNGATSTDIDVAKAAVKTAEVNLAQLKQQEDTIVASAKNNLLNSGFLAVANTNGQISTDIAPIISGTYLKDATGQIIIAQYPSNGGLSFKTSGLVEASGIASLTTPQAIGDTGLYIKYSSMINNTEWIVNIPNTESTAYTQNLNAYQNAEATETQVLANAQATLDQANSALVQKEASARPEDVAAALGALQVAEGAYANDFIYAPADGTITAVNINPGEITAVNETAISMIAGSNN